MLSLPFPATCASERSYRQQPIDVQHSALPNVFVVGAAKSGTTALYQYFKLHPQVYVPQSIKETNYMAFYERMPRLEGPRDKKRSVSRSVTTLIEYQRLYALRTTELMAADVSPCYLYYPQAADKIAELCPHAKIVMVLRNPVECAFSMYAMMRHDDRELSRSFCDGFHRSAERMAAGWEWGWDYQHYPMFSQRVARFGELFPSSQLFIRRYQDLKDRPQQFFDELNNFLGTNSIDVTRANRRLNAAPTRGDMLRKRRSGRWFLRLAHLFGTVLPRSLKTRIARRVLEPPAFALCLADRKMLVEHFATDILALAALLKWDLSGWLEF